MYNYIRKMNVIDDKLDAILNERRADVRKILDEKEAKKIATARAKAQAAFDDSDSDNPESSKVTRLDFGTNKIVNDFKLLEIKRNRKSKKIGD
jgi:hypothetical protein